MAERLDRHPDDWRSPDGLAGCRVLVTRPAGQNQRLKALIESAGGEALLLPTIEIQGLADASRAELEAAVARAHIVIFISANAVRYAMEATAESDKSGAAQIWAGKRLMAVGRATLERLRASGEGDVTAPAERFDSEALLALPELSAERVLGRTVLILKGEGGRDELRSALSARGASVETFDLYRRALPERAEPAQMARIEAREVDAVVVTSQAALDNLFELVGTSLQQALRESLFVAISQRVATRASARGITDVVVAREASDNAFIEALRARWAQRAL